MRATADRRSLPLRAAQPLQCCPAHAHFLLAVAGDLERTKGLLQQFHDSDLNFAASETDFAEQLVKARVEHGDKIFHALKRQSGLCVPCLRAPCRAG